MSQIITATFEDGVLKPERELGLAPGTKVRLILDPLADVQTQAQEACDALDQVCDEFPIDSDEPRMTRDQLYERR